MSSLFTPKVQNKYFKISTVLGAHSFNPSVLTSVQTPTSVCLPIKSRALKQKQTNEVELSLISCTPVIFFDISESEKTTKVRWKIKVFQGCREKPFWVWTQWKAFTSLGLFTQWHPGCWLFDLTLVNQISAMGYLDHFLNWNSFSFIDRPQIHNGIV